MRVLLTTLAGAALLGFLLAVGIVPNSPNATAGVAPGSFGDVSCDGRVNSVDAALILQFDAGLIESLPCFPAGDLNGDFSVNSVDAALILQIDAGLISLPPDQPPLTTPVPTPPGDLPPSTFMVDPAVQPQQAEIPGLDGGPPRPLAGLSDTNGNQLDFVENEIVLLTLDPSELESFVTRWEGEVLASVEPDPSLLASLASRGVDIPVPAAHLIRINLALAETANLDENLRILSPDARSDLRFSSEEGLLLFGAAADAATDGMTVALNAVFYGHDFDDRETKEAALGGRAPDGSSYTPDVFEWPYMMRERALLDQAGTVVGVQDIQVGEAWRALELTGRINNEVRVVVFDGGFAPNPDFPSGARHIGPLRTQNPASCTGGNPCPWHGTSVVTAGFGVPDNNFGAAGPGGPVTDLIVVQSPELTFWGITKFILMDAPRALAQGPDIINISAGGRLPAAACWVICIPLDIVTGVIRLSGTLIIASAGNEGDDVDAVDCFLFFCWEEAAWIPCELASVICVGGLRWDTIGVHPSSNYGRGEGATVDIYGPYEVWLGPEPDSAGNVSSSGQARIGGGTSYTAPFVAGVAALIWAADPSLSAGEVADILLETAHRPVVNLSIPLLWVNAYGGVLRALGNAPPDLEIDQPSAGAVFPLGAEIQFSALFVSDPEDGTPSLTWTSSIDGELGTGDFFTRSDLSEGTHTITATATDSGGFVDIETVVITVRNDPPFVEITAPLDGATFTHGGAVILRGTSTDSSEGMLGDSQVTWSSSLDGSLGTGHQLTVATLSQGTHTITFRGTDSQGASSEDTITLTINPPTADSPPTVAITSPLNNASISTGFDSLQSLWYIDVTLVGEATDPEDGMLTGTSLQWWSRMQSGVLFAQIGTGSPLQVRIYQSSCEGGHEILLEATDSAGNGVSDIIRVNWNRPC